MYSRYRIISDVPKAPPVGWEWISIFNKPSTVFVQINAKIDPYFNAENTVVNRWIDKKLI